MSHKANYTRQSREEAAQQSMQKQEAFYAGYRDQSAGVPRDRCPAHLTGAERRAWREGWDKSDKGLSIALPQL